MFAGLGAGDTHGPAPALPQVAPRCEPVPSLPCLAHSLSAFETQVAGPCLQAARPLRFCPCPYLTRDEIWAAALVTASPVCGPLLGKDPVEHEAKSRVGTPPNPSCRLWGDWATDPSSLGCKTSHRT